MSDAELLREAADLMRERAAAATPSPWRDSPLGDNRYGAIISDTKSDWRKTGGGWDETEHYGGYLIGESISGRDRQHIAAWDPDAAQAVADWLHWEAGFYSHAGPQSPTFTYAVAVARAYLRRPA
jgi:hypothetical protein